MLLFLHAFVQRWCENGGYISEAGPIELDISKPTGEVVAAFARFLKWYADGRKGDKNAARRGGRKVWLYCQFFCYWCLTYTMLHNS
jgi:hypothetical protein